MTTTGTPQQERFSGCGCIYVAFGFEYLMLAAHSARSVKRHNPGLPTTLVTNVPIEPLVLDGVLLFDQVIFHDLPSGANRGDKLAVDELSPYDRTLYLDCDTEIRGDLSPIFMLLADYDIAVRLLNRTTKASFEIAPGLRADALNLAEWNAGVIFFRRTGRTAEVFQRWRRLFAEEGMARDQPAFMRAILATRGLCILPIGPLWNAKPTRDHDYDLIRLFSGQLRIFHYRDPLRRPEIARAVYATYRNLPVVLRPERCSDAERGRRLAEEQNRFAVLYRSYAVLLAPFDNEPGRLLLLWRGGRVPYLMFRLVFRLRSLVLGGPDIRAHRHREVEGKAFPRIGGLRGGA